MSKVLGTIRFVCVVAALLGASAADVVSQELTQAGEDVELRLRRAAQALVSAEEAVSGFQAQLERERGRVVVTEVERELNRDTIARLEQALGSARARRLEFQADVDRLQKEREASRRPSPTPAPAPAPAPTPAAKPEFPQADVARALQAELGRLGCDAGAPDGVWGPASQQALREYNRYSKSNHEGPTPAALQELRDRRSRVCPLACRTGFRLDGDKCVAVERPTRPEDDDMFALVACNKDRNLATVAVSAPRKPLDAAVVSGWYPVPPGECKVIGRWAQGKFYWMAVDYTNGKNGWRGKALNICVPQTAFSRVRSGSYTCADNEKLEGFYEATALTKTYTINLNP